MSSVAAANPGVANLMQSLSVFNSPALSSQKVKSALEKAPSSDIVQLSMAATQMANVDALFGISNGSPGSSSTNIFSILANLEASRAAPGAPAATASGTAPAAASSVADQLATYQAAFESEVTQGLFGSGSSGGLSGSLLNLTG
jgi:hypothetical protein